MTTAVAAAWRNDYDAPMKAIQITETGGPDVLTWTDVPEPSPADNQVLVEVAAAGLNFIDTYHRTGLYALELPFVPGLEGAGTVTAVGANVADVSVGDTVAWSASIGTYAEKVAMPAAATVPVPDGVDLDVAAAVMLQGMTAHYLVTDTFPLAAGNRCLIHAGAGGVGLLLIQMAKMIGAEVFTTVGTPAKAELATGAGADHVILYREVDFGDEVERIAGERALDVVYDGVGQSVFRRSLDLLRPRGVMATFGNASGPVEPISPLELAPSLFLTRPSLFHYIATRDELLRRSGDLFGWIADGRLDVRIGERIPMAEAARAHQMLEGRQTTGKVILTP
jgi:NADPH2:quinone reductase